MKKLLCLILILAILIPTVSLADEQDPICALWHMYITKTDTLPSVWEVLDLGCDSMFMILDFRETGEVFLYDIAISSGIGKMESEIFGKWTKDGEHYTIQMLGYDRTIDAYLEDDNLIIALFAPNLYSRHSKLIPFDWYKDMFRN